MSLQDKQNLFILSTYNVILWTAFIISIFQRHDKISLLLFITMITVNFCFFIISGISYFLTRKKHEQMNQYLEESIKKIRERKKEDEQVERVIDAISLFKDDKGLKIINEIKRDEEALYMMEAKLGEEITKK